MDNYYERYAKEYAASTISSDMSDAYQHFLPKIEEGCRILDIGSGSGRDAIAFHSRGYRVTALEPSKNLCTEIQKCFHGDVVNQDVLSFHPLEKYDALWACASLLHLQKEELLKFFSSIDRFLKTCGLIYVSGKSGIHSGFDEKGRYFQNFSEKLLSEILQSNRNLSVIEKWYSRDVTGRTDFQWMNFILRYEKERMVNGKYFD